MPLSSKSRTRRRLNWADTTSALHQWSWLHWLLKHSPMLSDLVQQVTGQRSKDCAHTRRLIYWSIYFVFKEIRWKSPGAPCSTYVGFETTSHTLSLRKSSVSASCHRRDLARRRLILPCLSWSARSHLATPSAPMPLFTRSREYLPMHCQRATASEAMLICGTAVLQPMINEARSMEPNQGAVMPNWRFNTDKNAPHFCRLT